MEQTLKKLTNGSIIVLESSLYISKNTTITDLSIIYPLISGLAYIVPYNPSVYFYKNQTPTTPIYISNISYYGSNSIIIILEELLQNDEFRETLSQQDVNVVIQIPVTIADILKLPSETDPDNNLKYFTNNYELIFNKDWNNPLYPDDPPKIYWDYYKVSIYGGSDIIPRRNGIPVNLYGFFRSIDSSSTKNLNYTITMTINDHLDASIINESTKENIDIRLGNIDGPKLDPSKYTVTKRGQILEFKFSQEDDINGTDIYIVAKPTTLDIENDTQPVLFSPIKLDIKQGNPPTQLLGSSGPSQIETNIKSKLMKLKEKILITG